MAHFRDGFRARHRDLEDPRTDVTARASERLLDGLRVKRGTDRRRRRRRWAAQGRAARRQRLAKGARHLHGVAVPAVVHVHRVRRHLVEMVVDRRHLEPAGEETGHHRRDLLIEEDEIAHDHGLVADLLERRVGAQGEPRLHRHALHRDVEVGAGHPDPVDVAGLHRSRLPERLLDGLPVRIRGPRGDGHGKCDE